MLMRIRKGMFGVLLFGCVASQAWSATIETIEQPKYKHLKTLVQSFEAMTHDVENPWLPETYGQQLVVRVKMEEGESRTEVLEEVVRDHLRHMGEDYQASFVQIEKSEKSLENLSAAHSHLLTYATHLSSDKQKQFLDILRLASYRRPKIDLYLLIEGNDKGECRAIILHDRRYSEAIIVGSCQIL